VKDLPMYAVVDIAGKQFRISQNDKILIPSMRGKVGSTVTFNKVLLLGEDKQISVGNPLVAGASVEATVLDNMKDDKVIVFKKKKRKGYRLKRGHRQGYTRVQITKIGK
jgi:large subunit ribosomal protein L21